MATKLANRFEIAFSPHPEEVLQNKSIDLVDICTPTPTHFSYAKQALLTGKHVFCEKPLTPDVDEAIQLLELARQHHLHGMVAFVFKYHPVFTQAKSAIEAGAIGPLRAVFMRLGGKGSHRAWKHQTETGGGVVNEMMSHMLDLLLWFIGDVEKIDVVHLDNLIKNRHIDGREVHSHAEDFGLVAGTGVNGTKFVVQSDLTSPIYQNYIEIVGTDGYINLSILDSRESYLFLNQEYPPYPKGKIKLAAEPVDLFQLMFADFIKQIRENGSLQKNSFADAAQLARLLHEIKLKGRI